jgi:hypothetical protein
MGITHCTNTVPGSFDLVIVGPAWLNKEKHTDYKCRKGNGLIFLFEYVFIGVECYSCLFHPHSIRVMIHFSHNFDKMCISFKYSHALAYVCPVRVEECLSLLLVL